MLNIVIFGPPGSGKGTQSLNIAGKYGLVHLSTGDLLRQEMAENTPLGQEVRKFIDRGQLVPDEIIIRELHQKASEYLGSQGLILDGFPRTLVQAGMLDEMLNERGIPLNLVLSIEVDEEELFKRMMGRAQDSGRSDDQADIINHRINVYKQQTFPLIEYYKMQRKIVAINGMSPVSVVFDRISRAIDTYRATKRIMPEVR